MPRRLGVNIDHVATLRQARQAPYPDPVAAAMVAEMAGADQITCHIRSDRRHIQDADLPRLRDAVQTQLNVEMAATDEMIALAIDVLGNGASGGRLHRVTLVPERPEEVTTEGGLDVVTHRALIERTTQRLVDAGILVSLFIDPDEGQVEASHFDGIDMIEINTAQYADHGPAHIERIIDAAQAAMHRDIEVAAGHGLTHHNLPLLVEEVPEITEYNIGHSIIGRAVFVGLDTAVRDLCAMIQG
ncbi:MAG: pyridoxine 5'-phosphate synthase [Myxococcota bacterium]|nr:pyridoxine 5'-phosphate synthase [Myxococcota bacterium]